MSGTEVVEEWFRRYNREIYNFLIYYMRSADVDDLLQEVFLRAFKGLDRFQGDASPKTWLFSIARNVAIDAQRKKSKGLKTAMRFQNEQKEAMAPGPEELFQLSETKREIYSAIQSLKRNYSDVLLLRGMKEFSVAETAEILGWKETKVRVTFHRAQKALVEALEQKEGTSDE